jgi:hypothetical protein
MTTDKDEVKQIVIKLDDENDIIIHSPMEKAPSTVFCVLLSIGLTPASAKKYTDKIIYNLEHGIKLETVNKSDLEEGV